jgi:hypothetical protein
MVELTPAPTSACCPSEQQTTCCEPTEISVGRGQLITASNAEVKRRSPPSSRAMATSRRGCASERRR